ncbi:MAG TPA: thiol reductant ABC exporter subunit CydC [Candidatus Dormibacteraeota bacterium]
MITAPWRFLLDRAAPRLPRLGMAALVSLLCLASGVALLAVAGYLIQDASLRPPILSLDVAAVGVRLFSLLRASGRYLDRLATHDAVLRLLADTRVAVYEGIEPRSPGAFDNDRSGDLMRRIGGDVDALQDVYARSLLPPAVAALAIVVAAVVAGIIAAPVGITAVLVMAAAGIVVVLAATLSARGVAAQLAGLAGTLSAEITDTLQGCADLVGSGAVGRQLERVHDITTRIERASRRLAWSRAAASGLVSLATGATVVAVIIAAASVAATGALPAMATGIFALAAMALSEPFAILPAAVDGARTGLPSAARLVDITNRPIPVPDPVTPQPLPDSSVVVLDGISMRYAPEGSPAVDMVSLRLEPGSRVGIQGPSGSGKSSLAAVLVRFRDFDDGSFTLGGVDVRDLDGDAVRSRIGLVAQDAHIFATSIRENLRLARVSATDAELDAAAAGAHLLEWIATLPEGWDTLVGEHGAQISGGQRRRLALARALLADFPVLVVDEPTEALDDATAAAVMRDITAAAEDRALLVISHRTTDMTSMRDVYSMRHGVLARAGPVNSG